MGAKESIEVAGRVAVADHGAGRVQDAPVHRSCMKVDAGVGSVMLMVVQRPRGGLATASGCSHFFFE